MPARRSGSPGGAPALRAGVDRALAVIVSAAPARLLDDLIALTRRLASTIPA
jgi:hypothetical protein